ncbi:MAG: hypothetical protein F6K30_29135 [Cyanothece sp. SIO2G6]|nr:hypothetical protein [Cyanothece sp. SIO2G6]
MSDRPLHSITSPNAIALLHPTRSLPQLHHSSLEGDRPSPPNAIAPHLLIPSSKAIALSIPSPHRTRSPSPLNAIALHLQYLLQNTIAFSNIR